MHVSTAQRSAWTQTARTQALPYSAAIKMENAKCSSSGIILVCLNSDSSHIVRNGYARITLSYMHPPPVSAFSCKVGEFELINRLPAAT